MFRAFDLRLDKDEFGDCFGYYEKIGAEILSTHKQTFEYYDGREHTNMLPRATYIEHT